MGGPGGPRGYFHNLIMYVELNQSLSSVPIHRDLGDPIAPVFNREHNLDTVCLQPLLPVIMRNKRPWLFDTHVNSLDSTPQSQDPGRAGHVAAESLVTWLHSCV